MKPPTVLILGVAGGFGKLMTSLLSAEGYVLNGIDTTQPSQETADRLRNFSRTDAAMPSQDVIGFLESADWVISCMPQDATLAACRNFTPHLSAGALFMDVLSVKTPISSLMQSCRSDLEFLSIHPMFAPSVGFPQQNVVVVRIKSGIHSDSIESLLVKWGAHVHYLSAEQHDRGTVAVQVATHAAILSFGLALKAMGYNISEALPISSPPHRTLLALLARIVNGSPEVYWQIQLDHPLAPEARAGLIAAAIDLQKIIDDGSPAEFSDLLKNLRDMLDGMNDRLSGLAARTFALPLPVSE